MFSTTNSWNNFTKTNIPKDKIQEYSQAYQEMALLGGGKLQKNHLFLFWSNVEGKNKWSKPKLVRIFKAYDKDHNGEISLEEFLLAYQIFEFQ